MKPWRIIAALCAGLLVLGSCQGPEPEEPVLPAALTTPVLQLEPASGSVFLSVTASKDWSITTSYSGDSGWATVSPATGSGSRNSVIFSYGANESEEARSVTLTLTANPGGQASLTLTQKGIVKPDVPPQQYGYGYDVATAHWLELPATKADDGKEWFAHDMSGGDYFAKPNQQRNWSFYYDYDSYLATWVAYPLNNGLKGNGSRTNAWGYDPLLPSSWQQAIGQWSVRYRSFARSPDSFGRQADLCRERIDVLCDQYDSSGLLFQWWYLGQSREQGAQLCQFLRHSVCRHRLRRRRQVTYAARP